MRVFLLLILLLCPVAAGAEPASPFAVPGAPASSAQAADAPEKSGLVGWVQTKQRAFYEALRKAAVRLKRDGAGSAGWALLFVSFIYGLFHAAGPGHGKAVISSYLLANERAVRRGIGLAWASAFAQALTAVLLVGAVKLVFDLTARQVTGFVRPLELVSFALVAGLGALLVARALRRWRGRIRAHETVVAAMPVAPSQSLDAGEAHAIAHAEAHAHEHDHDHGACGHAHAPDPATLDRPIALREALGIVAAIGVRPCSGAILVLLFTLASGIFFWGVVSAFAMAAGTALAVSVLAVLAVGAKETALRLSGPGSARAATVLAGLELAGAGALLLIGLLLFYATATSPPPPLL